MISGTSGKILIFVEGDELAGNQLKAIVQKSYTDSIEIIVCKDSETAKKYVLDDRTLCLLITAYSVSDFVGDSSHEVAQFAQMNRPGLKQLGIGSFKIEELVYGRSRVLLTNAEELRDEVLQLVQPNLVSMNLFRRGKLSLCLKDITQSPYD